MRTKKAAAKPSTKRPAQKHRTTKPAAKRATKRPEPLPSYESVYEPPAEVDFIPIAEEVHIHKADAKIVVVKPRRTFLEWLVAQW